MAKRLQPLFLVSLVLISLCLLIIITYHLAYQRKIYPGVTILNQPMGNYTSDQAYQAINQTIRPESLDLILKTDGQEWHIALTELNFQYQPGTTIQQAYLIGRSGRLLADIKTKINCWFSTCNLNLAFSLNQDLLQARLEPIIEQLFIPTIEPAIKIEKGPVPKINIQSGQEGQQIDKRALLALINHRLSEKNINPIEIPLIQISPALNEAQVKTAQNRAEKLLGKKITLVNEENQWIIEEEELIGFLDFGVAFDREKINRWTTNLGQSINRLAENATFKFESGRVTQFQPAKEGQILNQTKTVDLIIDSLEKLQQDKTTVTTQLPVEKIAPQITTADVNNLGIKQLIGQGTSFFRGSISARLDNIQLAAARLNGLLITPEEVFSFNQRLGETSQATGFKPAYIIKEGQTILGDGGGVCQVSTTLFRAALDAGLLITERQAHAYRVSYYEQDYQPGFDATVFEPSPDLKFKNNTPAYILIQSVFDRQNSQLTFELYGTDDDRVVSLSPAKTWSKTPPPPDLYLDDPNLPVGQIKQIEKKIWGSKVSFDYKAARGSEVLQEKTFWSNYQPWQAVFLRGTGG